MLIERDRFLDALRASLRNWEGELLKCWKDYGKDCGKAQGSEYTEKYTRVMTSPDEGVLKDTAEMLGLIYKRECRLGESKPVDAVFVPKSVNTPSVKDVLVVIEHENNLDDSILRRHREARAGNKSCCCEFCKLRRIRNGWDASLKKPLFVIITYPLVISRGKPEQRCKCHIADVEDFVGIGDEKWELLTVWGNPQYSNKAEGQIECIEWYDGPLLWKAS